MEQKSSTLSFFPNEVIFPAGAASGCRGCEQFTLFRTELKLFFKLLSDFPIRPPGKYKYFNGFSELWFVGFVHPLGHIAYLGDANMSFCATRHRERGLRRGPISAFEWTDLFSSLRHLQTSGTELRQEEDEHSVSLTLRKVYHSFNLNFNEFFMPVNKQIMFYKCWNVVSKGEPDVWQKHNYNISSAWWEILRFIVFICHGPVVYYEIIWKHVIVHISY